MEPSSGRVPFREKIPCNKPARVDEPDCDCWSTMGVKNRDSKVCDPWLKPDAWAPAIFAGAPKSWKSGASMRICGKNTRVGHISLANGAFGIDVPMLSDDPNGKLSKTQTNAVFIQHGYCCGCDRFEWVLYSNERPDSPIVWFSCGTRLTI